MLPHEILSWGPDPSGIGCPSPFMANIDWRMILADDTGEELRVLDEIRGDVY